MEDKRQIMLILKEETVARLLPMHDVLSVLEEAFVAQARGEVSMPLRTVARGISGILGAMPAALAGAQGAIGAKLVTVFPENGARGVPTHNALITLFDPQTGVPMAVMDGRYITEVRTAAVSALATRALARKDAQVLAILGTGVQARSHLDALARVMTIGQVHIWGRKPVRAAALAAHARSLGLRAGATRTIPEATLTADVVCTVTSSHEPILSAADISPGTHINAVGFGGPATCELASDLIAAARIFIDSMEGALRESGNLSLARRDGALPAEANLTLLCDVIAGRAPGRQDPHEITLFDSLGIAIEDVACARLVFARADQQGVGIRVDV
jgi:alanine dehydrogenase